MISIIVPIYNVERFLRKCIESMVAQTYQDIEIILVDDGSPDNCGEICDEYARRDTRIKVVHQKNKGVSAARNAGLDIAKGEYIGFCDPDDFVAPEMYEYLLNAMLIHNTDIVACGYDYFSEDYELDKARKYPVKEDEIMSVQELYSKFADMPPTIRHGVVTKLFKKQLIGDIRFKMNLHSAEDVNFLLDYVDRISSAVFVHRPLYKNLVRTGSATHGGLKIQSLNDSFYVHDRMYAETVQKFPVLRSKAIAFLMDVCTLKYNESKIKSKNSFNEKSALKSMRRYLREKSLTAVFSKHIRWTTKIYYLFLWIRK